MILLQTAERLWPPGAVHDTVAAIARDPVFARSLRQSLLQRLLLWLGRGIEIVSEWVQRTPSARLVAIAVAAVIVAALAARLLHGALAGRDARRLAERGPRHSAHDPWGDFERASAAGDQAGAAHALYRAALASLAHHDRVRLDPSRTSGDYVRELRRRGSPSLPAFQQFAVRFESAVYGHDGCTAATVAELRHLLRPLEPEARAA